MRSAALGQRARGDLGVCCAPLPGFTYGKRDTKNSPWRHIAETTVSASNPAHGRLTPTRGMGPIRGDFEALAQARLEAGLVG
jgi:hypothetical protein